MYPFCADKKIRTLNRSACEIVCEIVYAFDPSGNEGQARKTLHCETVSIDVKFLYSESR